MCAETIKAAVGVAASAVGRRMRPGPRTARAARSRPGDGCRFHRRVGQRCQCRGGRARGRRNRSSSARGPTRIRSRPARPTPPPSPTRRSWSTTAAATTTGSTRCWPIDPMSQSVNAYSLLTVRPTRQRTRLLRPRRRQGGGRPGRRPTGRGRSRPRRRAIGQRQRIRPPGRHRDRAEQAIANRHPRRIGRRDRARGLSTFCAPRASPTHAGRLRNAVEEDDDRRRPTPRPCST